MFAGNQTVITSRGVIPIETVMPGDLVATDITPWGYVKELVSREYKGDLIALTLGDDEYSVVCTPDQSFLGMSTWRVANKLWVALKQGTDCPPMLKFAPVKQGVPLYPDGVFQGKIFRKQVTKARRIMDSEMTVYKIILHTRGIYQVNGFLVYSEV